CTVNSLQDALEAAQMLLWMGAFPVWLVAVEDRRWVGAPQALLTMLYRSTDCLSRCGDAMKNLAHSDSFHAGEKTAPSKPGTKHLGPHGCAQCPVEMGAAPVTH